MSESKTERKEQKMRNAIWMDREPKTRTPVDEFWDSIDYSSFKYALSKGTKRRCASVVMDDKNIFNHMMAQLNRAMEPFWAANPRYLEADRIRINKYIICCGRTVYNSALSAPVVVGTIYANAGPIKITHFTVDNTEDSVAGPVEDAEPTDGDESE